MEEFLPILNYVSKYIELTEEEKRFFVSLLRIRKVRKKQFIGQPEFTSKYRSYIVSGAFRAYIIDQKGKEHTIAIAIEDWWIGDLSSYIFQAPASYFIEALEDAVLIELGYEAEQKLLEKNPKFEKLFRRALERSTAALQQRLLSNLSKSAEQRYDEFVKKYPQFLNRIPQYILASYLGISTEFLSKIRNKKAKKLK
jgi:CRP-like cAMP-binding protein